MSDRLTRTEVLKLSLDEYIDRFVSQDDKLRPGYRGSYQYRQSLYKRMHYFAPAYQRQHQERMQRDRQARLRQQQLMVNKTLDHGRIRELRMQQAKLQRADIAEMRQLQKRLLQKHQEGLRELRQLRQQQRQHRLAMEQRIKEERRLKLTKPKIEHVKQEIMECDNEPIDESNNNLLKPIDQHNYNILVSLGIILPQTKEFDEKNTKCYPEMPEAFVPDNTPHWYMPTKQEIKREPKDNLLTIKVEPEDILTVKREIKTEIDNEYSTETIIAEIQQQMKEEIEMEDDINCDMLFIPTNLSINE